MREEHNNHPIDPGLEARIFALVLGEVSEFERAQLNDLIETRPELAAIQAEFESVHGLMRSVGTSEFSPADDEEWKLSPERRDVVLAAIRGESEKGLIAPKTNKPVILSLLAQRESKWSFVRIAATVCGAGFLGLMAMSTLLLLPKSRVALSNKGVTFERAHLSEQSLESAAPVDSGNSNISSWMFREAQVATQSVPVEEELLREASERESLSSQSNDFALQLPDLEEKARDYASDASTSTQGIATEGNRASRFGRMDPEAKPTSPSAASTPFFDTESAREAGKALDAKDMDRDGDGALDSVWIDLGMDSAPNVRGGLFGGGLSGGGMPADVGVAETEKSQAKLSETPGSVSEGRFGKDQLGYIAGITDDGPIAPLGAEGWEQMSRRRLERLGEITSELKEKVTPDAGVNETMASDEAFSTFSLHVSDVSFKLAQAALARGEWPDAAKVRIEEFVNAFDYGDPMPSENEKVACRVEQVVHPFLQQRNLLRVSMRTAAAGRAASTPLRLTFLLDNSGSMERLDRQQTVRRAFALLAQQLTPIDQVTLISFARQPRLLADKVSGEKSSQLVGLIDELPSEGGTNIETAIQLAFEKARENHLDGAQNRIVLLTDGAVNLGDADPESLSRMIETIRDAGIAFDAAGISAEGLNDEVLEALTRKGDGRYYLLDSLESADDGFARQIAGALRPSAKNVKVQVEFNPKRVNRYKLLGFEKHLLKQEDFRNDKVDAAEMAAAEAGVAVYQFEAMPDGEGDVGSVSVRFRDLATAQMVENRWPIPYEADAPRPDQASASLRIAASAALLAAKLRGEPLGASVDLSELSELVSGLPERDRSAPRVQQLLQMIEQARQISGE